MTTDKAKQKIYYKTWYYKNYKRTRRIKNEQQAKDRFGGNKLKVFERDNWQCQHCFGPSNLTVDHIDRNRSNNSMTNLQTLCSSCHGRKDGQARTIKSGWHWSTKEAKE